MEEEFPRKDNPGREARLRGEVVVAVHCMAETFAGVLGGAGLVTGDRKQPSGSGSGRPALAVCVLREGVRCQCRQGT